jgi:hypothetical protein
MSPQKQSESRVVLIGEHFRIRASSCEVRRFTTQALLAVAFLALPSA